MRPREKRDEQFYRDLEATESYRQLVKALEGTDYTAAQLNALLRGVRHYQEQAEHAVAPETWEQTLERLTDPDRQCELIPTGIGDLDALLDGGLQPDGVTGLVGGEGVGKSTLGKNVVYNAAKQGIKSIVVTLEGGIAGFRMPMLALESGIAYGKIREWWYAVSRPTQAETAMLAAAIRRLDKLPIIHSADANTIEKITRLCDEHPDAKMLKADSLHLIAAPPLEGIFEIEAVSKGLQRLAAERHLVVLALCEVNRVGQDVRDPVFIPNAYNIRGSRQLNHDFQDTLLVARIKGSKALRIVDGKGRHRADNKGDAFLHFDGARQLVQDGGSAMEEVWEDDAVRARAEKGYEPQRRGGGGRGDAKPDTSYTQPKVYGGDE